MTIMNRVPTTFTFLAALTILGSSGPSLAQPPKSKSKLAPVDKSWRIFLTKDQIAGSHNDPEKIPGLLKVEAKPEAKAEEKKEEKKADDKKKDEGKKDEKGKDKKKDDKKKDEKKKKPAPPKPYEGWPKDSQGQCFIEFEIPEAKKNNILIAMDIKGIGKPIPVSLVGAKKRGSKKWKKIAGDVCEKPADGRRKGFRDFRLVWPKGKFTVARLVFGEGSEDFGKVQRIRFYKLDKKKRNDYWVFVGAAMTVNAANPDRYTQIIQETFKDYDPYVVNEARNGWGATKFWSGLPKILKRHPHARYVCIHIGGANVSQQRPYPKGSKTLQQRLDSSLAMIRKAGKIPILARLSYRDYKKKGAMPAVPPESNGSGPYVRNIYDPLIRKYCRPFFDSKNRRGHVDLYTLFQENKAFLNDDGIGWNKAGNEAFLKVFAMRAAAIVYEGEPRPLEIKGGGDKKKKPNGPPTRAF